ncbi:MAG: phosphatidylserine decarboxylase [Chloroherpetonaceae bacterium]|nr:phosphatidylserine decarboxylase [Chloroherpetonaceae bacterium]
MITRYGYGTIGVVIVFAIVLATLGHFIQDSVPILAYLFLGMGIFSVLFALQFFRDPERTPKETRNVVISPADGKVVLVQEVEHHPYFNGKAKMVCIFMSPINVHVNRNPISGKINHMKYIEGEFIAAFDHTSGEKNERTEIGIENDRIKVFFKQISGFVARRIVCDLSVGDDVMIGERFGMIRFGSRVDMFLPPEVSIEVKLGQHASAGETIIARYA